MSVSRTHRLIRLIRMLQSGRDYDAEGLSHGLKVSRRTLFRDLTMLKAAGVPFSYDKRTQRYRIGQDFFLPPINFTVGEALALMLVTRKIAQETIHPDYALAHEAALKLESAIPAGVRRHCGALLGTMDVRFWPTSDPQSVSHLMHRIGRAMQQHRKLSMRYDSYLDRDVIGVTLHPYRRAFIRRAWYIIGYSESHGEVRTFKLERIVALDVSDETYDLPADFDLEDHFGNAWQMIRGDQRYRVRIQFAPMVAGNVEEVLWHKTQRITPLEDGAILFEVTVDGIDEISWWILGYGDQAVVLSPPELRRLIIDRSRRLLERYESAEPPPPPPRS